MKIELRERLALDDVFALIRDVRLRRQSAVRVYRDAVLMVRPIHPHEANPAQLYVLQNKLEFQRALRTELLQQVGEDPLDLACGLRLRVNDGALRLLLPPIIESTTRRVTYRHGSDMSQVESICIPVVHDGMHRLFLAKEIDSTVRVIWISRVPEEHPFYAHPVSWDRVGRVRQKPALMVDRRRLLTNDPDVLYREFAALDIPKPGD